MDMEVNLLLGGPDHAQPADRRCRTTRRCGRCAASPTARRTLRAGFTTVRNLGPVRPDRRAPARRRAQEGDRPRLDRRPPRRPRRPRHLPDRRPPRPDDVPGVRAARPAAHRRGGHRQRRRRGPQGRPLPDQVRRPGHQGLRVGRRDVAHRPGRRPAVLRRGARAPSPTRPTAPGSRSPPTPTATRASAPRIEAGIDCIEHGSLMSDETLDLFIERGTFLVATTYLADGMDVSHAAARAAGEGGRGVPPGQGHHQQGHRPGRQGRVRHRRPGHPPRPQRQGAARPGRPGHDPAPGHPRRHHRGGRAHRRRRPRPARGRPATPTSSPCPATRSPTSPSPSRSAS